MRAQNRMLRCALLFATTALTTLAHAQGPVPPSPMWTQAMPSEPDTRAKITEAGAKPMVFPDAQTASEHYLPPWGMKPTVLDQRNPLDLHPLTRTH